LSTYTRRGFIGTIIVLTLFLILLLWPIVTHAASDNLLANPSFEDGTAQYRTYGNGRYGLASTAHSGSKSFQIARDADDLTDKYGRLVTVIKHNPINNPEKLVFSTWLKSGSGSETVDLLLTFWGSDGRSYLAARRNVVTVGSSWQQVNVTTSNIPNNAAYVRAEIRLRGAGTIYLDDLFLSSVGDANNEPSPTPTPPDEPITSGTIYVAKDGNDSNPGTRERPLRHIQTAVDAARPGDTILVRGGTYVEELNVDQSGTAQKPIQIRNYPNEKPVIDGRYQLPPLPASGWALCGKQLCFHNDGMVNIRGSHIIFEGFEIKESLGRGIRIFNPKQRITNVTVRNNRVHDIRGAGILLIGVDHSLIEGNDVFYVGNFAPYDRSGHETNWPGAITGNDANYVTYRQNKVHQNWTEGIMPGSRTGSHHIVIEENELWDNRALQIYIHRISHSRIEGNIAYCTGDKRFDRGADYPPGIIVANEPQFDGGVVTTDVQISNNLVYGCVTGIGVWNAQSAYLLKDIQIAHNTIVNTRTKQDRRKFGVNILSHSNKNFEVANNIIQGVDGSTEMVQVLGGSGIAWHHNLWSEQPNLRAFGRGDIVKDAGLVNKHAGVSSGAINVNAFKLTAGSPANGTGGDVGVQRDFFNSRRPATPDMGFHER
jgi:hypothetical protein